MERWLWPIVGLAVFVALLLAGMLQHEQETTWAEITPPETEHRRWVAMFWVGLASAAGGLVDDWSSWLAAAVFAAIVVAWIYLIASDAHGRGRLYLVALICFAVGFGFLALMILMMRRGADTAAMWAVAAAGFMFLVAFRFSRLSTPRVRR